MHITVRCKISSGVLVLGPRGTIEPVRRTFVLPIGRRHSWKDRDLRHRPRSARMRLRSRRLKFVREQFFLAAVAQNIKRLVRFLCKPTGPMAVAA